MGKKTNWTTAEDQTLCRVWLSASDLQLHGGDQKASNFWNVVLELFHQEVESPVERPLNGLKVRWTRINRDSQKFASIFNELQSKRIKRAEEGVEDVGDNAAVALLTEQPWIDDAKVVFHRIYNTKFSFETCWKQLRYSAKWMQLFANSSSYPVLGVNVPPAAPSGVTEEAIAAEAAEAPSDTSSEADAEKEEQPAVECAAAASSPVPSVTVSAPPTNETVMSSTTSSVVAVASAIEASDTNAFIDPNHKRRADMSLESFAQIPHQNQLQRLTSTLVDELKRQNDLMEDQNAIALLKINNEHLLDEDTRQCYHMLRARYLKKACNNSRTSTLV
uniref:No apical meristem-associated C-terminal domain-containing protein n=1 Tax=Hyaloperonospora arabidopsidis (strain Emoy2) TaxID=559515 RepID=M4B941_HYAAE